MLFTVIMDFWSLERRCHTSQFALIVFLSILFGPRLQLILKHHNLKRLEIKTCNSTCSPFVELIYFLFGC